MVVAFLAAWISGPGRASATTLLPLTLDKLAGWSDAIVLGRCEEVWSEEDAEGIIRTRVRFRVEETWKGIVPEVIDIAHLGGTIDRRIAGVPGSPRFEPSEEAVLFLQAFADRTYGVVGLFQGKFAIERSDARGPAGGDGAGGERLVARGGPDGDRGGARTEAGSMRILEIDDLVRPDGRVSLEDFESMVRRLLAAGTVTR